MLRSEGEQHRILGGRRLQFEIELTAETLAQRQTPCAIDPAAEWRVEHELHAARFIEETLDDDCVLRRHRAERGLRGVQACRDFLRRRIGDYFDFRRLKAAL